MTALRAPRADGDVVAHPPLDAAGDLLAANRPRLDRADRALGGAAWADFRRQARAEILDAACRYLRDRSEPLPPIHPDRVIVAGHQPELFHPGVWVKHFALCGLTRRHAATPLNLIVDGDTVKTTSVRVPLAPDEDHPWPRLGGVPFDRPGEVPWEDRTVEDPALFESFPERVAEALRGWELVPMLPAFWAEVRRAPGNLGERLTAARRAFERAWGCHNLEVPLSVVGETRTFRAFAEALAREAGRFREVYNAAVRAYRRANRVRSRNHPVPDLARDGDRVELPFWTRDAGARRGRLFVREGEGLPPGTKVRSRALTTTMFARLFLGDLFIHGIGGGKYDEVTDGIIRGFFDAEPPGYLVLSATRLLPLPPYPATDGERRGLIRRARDVHYNPQRHLPPGVLTGLVRERERWVAAEPPTRAGRRERYRAIRDLSERLREPLLAEEQALRARLERCERERAANATLRRRDYAFVLYPEATLRPFGEQFLV